MKKVALSGLVAGCVLFTLSLLGLYVTLWLFHSLAEQYFAPAFDTPSSRYMIYYVHPFIMAMALSWFWQRFKGVLTGSFLTRGIEFGLIYAVIALVPMMWMIYSAMNVSIEIVATWLLLGSLQGIVAGLVFEKMNP
ncbi:hypothetical protein BH09BAC1_BH09BAC1_19390 [soil metagenome]